MVTTLYESPYEYPYKVLLYYGMWVINNKNYNIKTSYFTYKMLMCALILYTIYKLLINFYSVYGNFNKMTWNMCVTIVFAISAVTNFFALKRSKVLNALRENLHEDNVKRENKEEYANIELDSLNKFLYIKRFFFGSAVIFVPAWLLTFYFSYLWGPRELPIPAVLFFDANLKNNDDYNLAFCIQSILGILGISYILNNKLSMYTLLIQICREYEVFLHDITKLDLTRSNLHLIKEFEEEVNPFLKKIKIKMIIKEFAVRQEKLFQYVKDFETCFNIPLFFRAFVGTVLATVSAIQCLLALDNASFSMNLTYQSGYVTIILFDIFLLALLSSRVKYLCNEVGTKFYFTVWYKMDVSVRRDIAMIILRAHNNPRITTAKLAELDLSFFMHTLKNIYSLLTLFRQMM